MRYYHALLLVLLALLAACRSEKKAYYVFSRRAAYVPPPARRQTIADQAYMQPLRSAEVVGEDLPCPSGRFRRKQAKARMMRIPVMTPDHTGSSATLQEHDGAVPARNPPPVPGH